MLQIVVDVAESVRVVEDARVGVAGECVQADAARHSVIATNA
jgi:hypothetical protein